MNCPVCKKEFNEHTGRRPKKFCSDECKIRFWNDKKKVVLRNLNEITGSKEIKPPKTTNTNIDTTPKENKVFDDMEKQFQELLKQKQNG